MKVAELLVEKYSKSTDKGYYAPHYAKNTKHIGGTVEDWMARLGVESSDIKDAVEQAKSLASYKDVIGVAGDVTTAREAKNGTFSFQHPGSVLKDAKYHVYASGQIRMSAEASQRWSAEKGERRPTRLASPKPRLVHGDAVKSLVKIYDGAFKELASKAKKILGKVAK